MIFAVMIYWILPLLPGMSQFFLSDLATALYFVHSGRYMAVELLLIVVPFGASGVSIVTPVEN